MKRHISIATAILLFTGLHAATYFASPAGGGDGKSLESPTTFSQGLSLLTNAGDTLYLLDGQYDLLTTDISNKKGTASKRIVISGYSGINAQGSYNAILDFRQTAYGSRGLQIKSSSSYLHIKNLTLRYSGKNNILNNASNCIFENLDIYGSADTGCQMKECGNNIIRNVDSHDNFDYKTMSGTTANFGGNADGFADKQFSGAGNHYIGCRAWGNSDDGWDFYERVSTSQTVIENCICYQNGPATYDMTHHPRYQTDKSWFDEKIGTTMKDRYGNTITITLDQFPCQGNGNGFKMGGGYTNHIILIHHCLAVGNYARGFDQNNNDGTMLVYNNSAYANVTNYGFTTSYGTNTMRNCISFQSQKADQYSSKIVTANDHNSWSAGYGCSAADFQSLDTTQILVPRLSDGSLREGTLMRLAAGSGLTDSGIDVGLDFMGDAPDLGCYETDGVKRPSILCTSNNAQQWISLGDSIEPIVFQWGGSAIGLVCSALPEGLEQTINEDNQTLCLSGTPNATGILQVNVTTLSEESVNPSLSAIVHVKSPDAHRVAFVTIPGSDEDAVLLTYLQQNDSLRIIETDAGQTGVDYSDYDVIVIGSKPSSSAAGLGALEGYNKPMLLLKPFMLKNTVWNWGTSINTQDLSIQINDANHPIFQHITIANDQLQLFSRCNTNAVTAISSWTNTTGFSVLATPASQTSYTTVADFPPGTDCNGTILPQRMVMIGVSEYSTGNLTHAGKRLIENAICYLLGMEIPMAIDTVKNEVADHPVRKVVRDGKMYIIRGEEIFTITGTKIH